MTNHQNDLLTESIFGVEGRDGRSRVSLAGLLARLGQGVPTEMTALMSHQQHPWHAFVVQLAALVLARNGDTRLDRSEIEWCDALRNLAGGEEAFSLVVPDLSKPGFMQSPVPEGSLSDWKKDQVHHTPGELDVIPTARNHDVKIGRFSSPALEHWIYALVSLQTNEMFMGAKNWGIARMNGGTSSRPCISAARSSNFEVRFTRDVTTWLQERERLVRERGYDSAGIGLVWAAPWDGEQSLAPSDLDPFFIEVCRRVRFVSNGCGGLQAHYRPTNVLRISPMGMPKAYGATGDIWTPLKTKDGGSLTVSSNGFDYRTLSDLLFSSDWRQSPSQIVRKEDGPTPVLIACALARKQGGTEGLHERVIPIPEKAKRCFASPGDRVQIGKVAKDRVARVLKMRDGVLKHALLAIVQGGPTKINFKDKSAKVHLDAFEQRIDGLFFEHLFDAIGLEPEESESLWDALLLKEAKDVKKRAEGTLTIPISRRYKALAAGDRTFLDSSKKHKFYRPVPDTGAK